MSNGIEYEIINLNEKLVVKDDGTLTFQKFGLIGGKLKKENVIKRDDVVSVSIPFGGSEGKTSVLNVKTQDNLYSIGVTADQYEKLEAVYYYLCDKDHELLDTIQANDLKIKLGIRSLITQAPLTTSKPIENVETPKETSSTQTTEQSKGAGDVVYTILGPISRLKISNDGTIIFQNMGIIDSNKVKSENKFLRDDVVSVTLDNGETSRNEITLKFKVQDKLYVMFVNITENSPKVMNDVYVYLHDKTSEFPNLDMYAEVIKETASEEGAKLAKDEYAEYIETQIKTNGVFDVDFYPEKIARPDSYVRNLLRIYDNRILLQKTDKSVLTLNYSDITSIEFYQNIQGAMFFHGGIKFNYAHAEKAKDNSIFTFLIPECPTEEKNVFYFSKNQVSTTFALYLYEYLNTRLEKVKTSTQQPSLPTTSLADEIGKLNELLKMGAITQEEFDSAKKKLLGL